MQLANFLVAPLLNAALYLRYPKNIRRFFRRVGYLPNIAFPTRYHEKLLWRKIFDHNPAFIQLCDKLASKDLWRALDVHVDIPETVWQGTNVDEIPTQFRTAEYILKANHGCKFHHLLTGQDDWNEVQAKAEKWLSVTYYGKKNLEWSYSHVAPTLFVEKLIIPVTPLGLLDINIRCNKGHALLGSMILNNKQPSMKVSYYDREGQPAVLTASNAKPRLPDSLQVPAVYHQAVKVAEVMSQHCDYARYDFMSDGERLFAGEVTIYPAAGLTRATLPGQSGHDTLVNDDWDLLQSWFVQYKQPLHLELYKALLKQHLKQCKGITESNRQTDTSVFVSIDEPDLTN